MVKQVIKNNLPYALISGGSKGIGFAIGAALAGRNYNLVLIARNGEDLNAAKNKIERQYPVQVDILAMDLSQPESAEKIGHWCAERDLPLKILCNVTGIGGAVDFLSAPLSDNLYMLRLNTEPAVSLTYHLLALLKKNQPSYILNVSSMAGFAPISIKNIYSATKSAMIFFSYSLRYQLKKENISVSCLCPGPVFTKPEIEKETIKKLGWLGRQMAVPVEKLGRIAVDQTFAKAMIIVPGIIPKIVSVILRILPRRLISFIYYKLSSR
ncbi:MAG TPA: SDR family NAD(P)-dependent oxidoreductase [Puia sp.]|jgi:short-subunit dehydrogenase